MCSTLSKCVCTKLKYNLDSALHLQDFLRSTDMANSLMTDTEYLYMQATQLCDRMEEKQYQLTWYGGNTCICSFQLLQPSYVAML